MFKCFCCRSEVKHGGPKVCLDLLFGQNSLRHPNSTSYNNSAEIMVHAQPAISFPLITSLGYRLGHRVSGI